MFIQITPEGYTPDGAYRLVPVDIEPHELQSIYQHAMGQSLRERDAREVGKFRASVIETAPPPPAELLANAKRKVLMPEDMLAKARRALAHAATNNSLYQEDYDDFCAAIDAARGK